MSSCILMAIILGNNRLSDVLFLSDIMASIKLALTSVTQTFSEWEASGVALSGQAPLLHTQEARGSSSVPQYSSHDQKQRGEPALAQPGAADSRGDPPALSEGQEESGRHHQGRREVFPEKECFCTVHHRGGRHRQVHP